MSLLEKKRGGGGNYIIKQAKVFSTLSQIMSKFLNFQLTYQTHGTISIGSLCLSFLFIYVILCYCKEKNRKEILIKHYVSTR